MLPEVISITDDCSRPGVLLIRVDLLELILTCVVLGVPPPQVTWVGPQVTMVTTSTEMMGRLVQANATLSSPSSGLAGNYTCIGTNELGVASRSVQVEEQSGEFTLHVWEEMRVCRLSATAGAKKEERWAIFEG